MCHNCLEITANSIRNCRECSVLCGDEDENIPLEKRRVKRKPPGQAPCDWLGELSAARSSTPIGLNSPFRYARPASVLGWSRAHCSSDAAVIDDFSTDISMVTVQSTV